MPPARIVRGMLGCAVWLVLLTWGLLGLSRTADRDAPVQIDATRSDLVPVWRTASGHLLVRPRLDGRTVGWFVFDTGASRHVIAPRIVRQLSWVACGQRRLTSGEHSVLAATYRAEELALGPTRVARPLFLEADLRTLEASLGVPLAGIVGAPLLRGVVCEVDVRGATLRFTRDASQSVRSEWYPLQRQARPVLRAHVLRHDQRLLLDTGFPGSLLLYERDWQVRNGGASAGLLGPHRSSRVTLDRLEVAGHRFESLPVWVADRGEHADVDGLVGCAVLDAFLVILDGVRGRVAFQPHAP